MPELYICILFTVLLFYTELLYFRIADKYNIIDHPNIRSSHSEITLLGGGILFPLAILLYSIFFRFPYPYFLVGLILISIISFWDDLHTVSPKFRLAIHVLSVFLLFTELDILNYPLWAIIIIGIIVIGTINAYNFMDGINGMTGLYSLIVIINLIYLNESLHFVKNNLLWITAIALLVFLFFNFRKKAKCFAGDVGSVSMAFIVLFALALLIIHTQQPLYILFLAVYGVDAVLTIISRLFNRENIFEAHRSHAYQILSNERGLSHLNVAVTYASLQLLINALLIYAIHQNLDTWLLAMVAFFILLFLALLYTIVKHQTSIFNKKPLSIK
jgi:UDP-GlcNAc:undecaprenyl-phosphate/decaprenyl-phosphate GlcNAc-1-phosphate transferase